MYMNLSIRQNITTTAVDFVFIYTWFATCLSSSLHARPLRFRVRVVYGLQFFAKLSITRTKTLVQSICCRVIVSHLAAAAPH